MIGMCYKKDHASYSHYGAKGICVCVEWKESISNFIEWAMDNGYKTGLTIDRIKSNGDYSPENCQWISMRENVQKDKPKYLFSGEYRTIPEISCITGIRQTTIRYRLANGWEFNDAVTRYALHSNKKYLP